MHVHVQIPECKLGENKDRTIDTTFVSLTKNSQQNFDFLNFELILIICIQIGVRPYLLIYLFIYLFMFLLVYFTQNN